MVVLLKDILMEITNDYHENTRMVGSDYRECEDKYALWQAFEGELKTKKGTCKGIGLIGYGSRLHELVGENMNEYFETEVEDMVMEVAAKYPGYIKNVYITFTANERRRGYISMDITLDTIFGPMLNLFTYDTGCDD